MRFVGKVKGLFMKERVVCIILLAFYAVIIVYFLYHEQFGWWWVGSAIEGPSYGGDLGPFDLESGDVPGIGMGSA